MPQLHSAITASPININELSYIPGYTHNTLNYSNITIQITQKLPVSQLVDCNTSKLVTTRAEYSSLAPS